MRLVRPVMLVTSSLILTAATALGGNTGFRLGRPLIAGPRNFVSLPYLYFPNGDPATPQSTLDVCRDIGRADCGPVGSGGVRTVTYVEKADDGSLKYSTQPCQAPFATVPDIAAGTLGRGDGERWPIFVAMDKACRFDIVGAHDDRYSLGGPLGVRLAPGNNPVSMPYHLRETNSVELCWEINRQIPHAPGAGPVVAIARMRPDGGGFSTQDCVGPPLVVFAIVPGDGLLVTFRAGTAPVSFDWNHF